MYDSCYAQELQTEIIFTWNFNLSTIFMEFKWFVGLTDR